MESEGTLRVVFGALTVNDRPRYDIWIIRVKGRQGNALACKINTVRFAYVVCPFTYEDYVAALGVRYGLLDCSELFRDLEDISNIRFKLDSNNFVAVHRYVYGIKIPAPLVIGGAPACDPIA